MAKSCPLEITHCVLQENSVPFPFNSLFIDQTDCLVKMSGCWPHSALLVLLTDFGPGLRLSSYTCKKELGQYPAILALRFVKNPYVFYLNRFFIVCRVKKLSCIVSSVNSSVVLRVVYVVCVVLFKCKV